MFEAIPSSEPASSSPKWWRLPNIMSRITSSDHLSPITSIERLIGHPDLPSLN
jgi:hypothetical protein